MANSLNLTSTNGKHSITLSATNSGPVIELVNSTNKVTLRLSNTKKNVCIAINKKTKKGADGEMYNIGIDLISGEPYISICDVARNLYKIPLSDLIAGRVKLCKLE